MPHSLLRYAQHEFLQTQYYQGAALASTSLIIALATYIPLLVVSATFLRLTACAIYDIPICPTEKQKMIIKIIAVVLLGLIGIGGIAFSPWSIGTWICYGLCNLLFAAFMYVYSTDKPYSLKLSVFIFILLTIDCLFLDIGATINYNFTMVTNMVGMVSGWTIIWSMFLISQLLVHNYQIQTKTQTKVFFIGCLSLIVLFLLIKIILAEFFILNLFGFAISCGSLLYLMYRRSEEYDYK